MNNMQRILFVIYLPITFLILIFDHIYPIEDMVQYLKYTIMITLFLFSISIKKKFHEQKIMALSFFFLVIADFFLVFSTTLDNFKMDVSPFGVVGFLFAYLCLIVAYQKNFKIGKEEIMSGIPVVSVFMYVFISLQPYVNKHILIGTLIFGIVLCYMTWTGICTLFRNYFNLKISRLIAISSILMFICDLGVAFSKFHPVYSKMHVPWLDNIIWAAYIPGWTILAVIINEKNLLINVKDKSSFRNMKK